MEISWGAIGTVAEWAGAFLIAGIGYFVKKNDSRLDSTEGEMKTVNVRLNQHMLDSQKQWNDAERRFAKEETMQSSLARIHDRLDETASKNDIVEVRNDIKGLLKVVKG